MHKVKRLFASGSVLTSRFTEKSDIDLVADSGKEVEQVDYVNNLFDLREHLPSEVLINPILAKNGILPISFILISEIPFHVVHEFILMPKMVDYTREL